MSDDRYRYAYFSLSATIETALGFTHRTTREKLAFIKSNASKTERWLKSDAPIDFFPATTFKEAVSLREEDVDLYERWKRESVGNDAQDWDILIEGARERLQVLKAKYSEGA